MATNLLLPHKYKIIGRILLIPATVLGLILIITDFQPLIGAEVKVFALFDDNNSFTFITTDIDNTVIGVAFIIGALLTGFSKEKREDEFIAELRLSSLLWAVWVNYILLLLAFIFIYGTAFLQVMLYNMFTVLIIFVLRFNYLLYITSKAAPDEK